MKFEQQTLALLQLAKNYSDEHCQALLAKASQDWSAVVKAAHAAARRELRARISPERERIAIELAKAEARLVTRRRARDQRRVVVVLRQAWPRLQQALRESWQTPSVREPWVRRQLAIALRVLPVKGWIIRYPENWPAAEQERASRWLQSHGIEDARFEPDADLCGGIRIACGLNVLDASLDGLLADRAQIEGRLLYYLEQER